MARLSLLLLSLLLFSCSERREKVFAGTHHVLFLRTGLGQNEPAFVEAEFDMRQGRFGQIRPVKDLRKYSTTIVVEGEKRSAIPVSRHGSTGGMQYLVGEGTVVLGPGGDVIDRTNRWQRNCIVGHQRYFVDDWILKSAAPMGPIAQVSSQVTALGCASGGVWRYHLQEGLVGPDGKAIPDVRGVVDDIGPLPGHWLFVFVRRHERSTGKAYVVNGASKKYRIDDNDWPHVVVVRSLEIGKNDTSEEKNAPE